MSITIDANNYIEKAGETYLSHKNNKLFAISKDGEESQITVDGTPAPLQINSRWEEVGAEIINEYHYLATRPLSNPLRVEITREFRKLGFFWFRTI